MTAFNVLWYLLMGSVLGAIVAVFVVNQFDLLKSDSVKMHQHYPGVNPEFDPGFEVKDDGVEEIDYDELFFDIKEENRGEMNKLWFEKRVENAEQQADESMEKLEKQGDDAQSEFDKYR